jgi:hypothetical protein
VSARRYLLGWAALVVATMAVTAGTVVVVRQAIGGGDLVNALSQGEVRSQYSAAGGPRPSLLATAGSTPTSPSPASTSPPPDPSTGGSKPAHNPSSSTTPAHHSGAGSSSHGGGSTPSHSPPSSGSITLVLTSSGGSVVARCSSPSTSATVYLVSWSPAQGYQVDDVRRGPAQVASIHLEGGQDEISVTYSCSATGPVQQVQHDDGSGGGDD